MNFDDYEQLPTPSTATNVSDLHATNEFKSSERCMNQLFSITFCYSFQMIAGGAAGILEHCVMYPVDSIKVGILTNILTHTQTTEKKQ